MTKRKEDGTDELDDDQLSSVSGGVGVVGAADTIAVDPTPAPADSASGKVKFNEFTIKKTTDKASP